jgi:hypothetical protein
MQSKAGNLRKHAAKVIPDSGRNFRIIDSSSETILTRSLESRPRAFWRSGMGVLLSERAPGDFGNALTREAVDGMLT